MMLKKVLFASSAALILLSGILGFAGYSIPAESAMERGAWDTEAGNSSATGAETETVSGVLSESEAETETEMTQLPEERLRIQIGDSAVTALLEDNASAEALKELLADGSITIEASNYGGFEKVCSLGRTLPSSDTQITGEKGDILLYSSDRIVIFYGQNSWAYTRLGRVEDRDLEGLSDFLSGPETEVTLSLIRADGE